ncbi:MAG: hypothetical protein ABH870_08995 [bacterium]
MQIRGSTSGGDSISGGGSTSGGDSISGGGSTSGGRVVDKNCILRVYTLCGSFSAGECQISIP